MFSTSVIAVLGLASLSSGHMLMNTPVPFGKSSLNNSPLSADGSDFPCKQRSGVYSAEGANNVMALGSSQPLAFTGSAVHGGGSCQISITYDEAPTKNSVFKVIHSIEGGCPMRGVAGNNGDDANAADPSTYSFTVPANLPTGTATLAWTWFNKIGNREMYMNCAPITITGSKSKRSDDDALLARNVTQLLERDTAAFNALPDMFVANIGNGCGTQASTDLLFPNPGDSVEQDGLATSAALATPTGSGCGAKVAGAAPTAGSGSASASGLPGGVFVTVAPSALATTPPANTPAAAPPAQSTPASSPAAAAPPAQSTSATPPSAGASGSGAAIAAGTACSTEGEWNCIGGTSFQQCASGTWSVVQQLAAGTKCTAGLSADINIVASANKKRAVRFSNEHIRRHLHRSS